MPLENHLLSKIVSSSTVLPIFYNTESFATQKQKRVNCHFPGNISSLKNVIGKRKSAVLVPAYV